MLYSEFIEGTGCKDSQHNYEVYRNLEAMYMNSDMSKQEIYEYGKKLVDNSKSEKQLAFEAEINQKIAECKEEITWNKERIETLEYFLGTESDMAWIKAWKEEIKERKKNIKTARANIKGYKWVLG